jgi:hypothetical protein
LGTELRGIYTETDMSNSLKAILIF